MAKLDIFNLTEEELDNLDLTTLSATELVQYGEIANWSTEDLRNALELRNAFKASDTIASSLRSTLEDLEKQFPTTIPARAIEDSSELSGSILWRIGRFLGIITSR
jgi:hypothetical protein